MNELIKGLVIKKLLSGCEEDKMASPMVWEKWIHIFYYEFFKSPSYTDCGVKIKTKNIYF
jgi:hypothetical protein